MKLYVSGPITGVPNNNEESFNEATEQLLALGHVPINPLALDDIEGHSPDWNWNLRRDIKYLMDCDGLCLLTNWELSTGARLEVVIAKSLDYKIYRLSNNELVEEHVALDVELTPLIPSYLWAYHEKINTWTGLEGANW
jgi:hypothetical protein